MIVKNKKVEHWLMNGYDRDYKFIDFQKSKINKVNGVTNEIRSIDIRLRKSELYYQEVIEI